MATHIVRLLSMKTWTSTSQGMPGPFWMTDAELWELVAGGRSPHRRAADSGTCAFCDDAWPCGAERLSILTGAGPRIVSA